MKSPTDKNLNPKLSGKANKISDDKIKCRTLFSNANEAIIIVQNGKIKFFNPMMLKMSGLKETDLKGRTFLDLIFAEDQARAKLNEEKQIKGEIITKRESLRILNSKGELRWIDFNKILIKWRGQPATLNFLTDVTDRKITEDEKYISEIRYRRLFESAKDGILILNADNGDIVDVNPFLIDLLEYSKDQFLAKKVWELGPFRDIYKNQDKFLELQKEEYIRYADLPLETLNGKKIDVEFVSNVYLVNDQKVIQCNIRNITDRKQAEKALINSEIKNRTLVEHLPQRIFIKDINSKYILCNGNYSRDLGVAPDEIVGKDDYAFFPRELAEKYQTDDHRVMSEGMLKEFVEKYMISGQARWTHVIKIPYRDANEKIIGVLGIFEDITERKVAEKKINFLADIVQSSGEAIIGKNLDGIITSWNKGAENIYGYAENEVIGKSISLLALPDTLNEDSEIVDKIRTGHHVTNYETVRRRKDGREIHVSLSVSPILNDNGEIVATSTIAHDITERKRLEDTLIKERNLLQTLIDNLPDYIYAKDRDGKFILGNSAIVSQVGLKSKEELIGKTDFDFFPKGLAEKFQNEEEKILISGKPLIDYEGPTIDQGKEKWISTSKVPLQDNLGNVFGTVGIGHDITARKIAEQSMRLQSAALQAAANAIVITDIEGKIQWVNRAFCELTGFNEEETIGKNPRELVKSDEHKPEFYNDLWKTILDGKTWKGEIINRKKNGRLYDEEMTINPLRDPEGKISHFIAIKQDITERKKAETVLRENEADLKRAQSVAHIGTWQMNIINKALTWSPETYKIFGLPPDIELSYDKFISCVHPDDLDRVKETMGDLLKMVPTYLEHRINVGDQVKWVREIDELEMDAAGIPVRRIGTVQDITLQKLSEGKIHLLNNELETRIEQRTRQLVEANKELETFAYSISHDLRAPLRSINGYSEILKKEYKDKLGDEGKRVIDTVIRNSTRMGQLIDDLLEFSRLGRHNLVTAPVNMQTIVEEVVNEISSQAEDRKIEIKINSLPPCTADPSMIRQVWINLVGNAVKYSRKKESASIEIGSSTDNGSISYFVKDNGTGFDMKYYHKLFNVFQRLHNLTEFEGTGVGLALVKRIVTRHGGKVWAEGKIDEGATFYFSLTNPSSSGKERNKRS